MGGDKIPPAQPEHGVRSNPLDCSMDHNLVKAFRTGNKHEENPALGDISHTNYRKWGSRNLRPIHLTRESFCRKSVRPWTPRMAVIPCFQIQMDFKDGGDS